MWDLSVGESLENDGSLDNKSLKQTIRRDENGRLANGGIYTVEFIDGSGIVLNARTLQRLDVAFRGKTVAKASKSSIKDVVGFATT
eukprot:6489869-Prymnesium_polylepis.1